MKRLAVLVDNDIAVSLGTGRTEPKPRERREANPVDAASYSLLLTARAANSENSVVKEPHRWFSNLTGKMGELGWNLMAKEIANSASEPTLTGSTYLDEIICRLSKSLKDTTAKDDTPEIEKAAKKATGVSGEYAGTHRNSPGPAALCRGLGHAFQGQEGPELALAYAWLQHTDPQPDASPQPDPNPRATAPRLTDTCDSGSKLWILLWRGKLLDKYDHQEVVKILDDQLPGWQNKIRDVSDGD